MSARQSRGARTGYAPLIVDIVCVWRADRRWFEVHTSQVFCFETPVQVAKFKVHRALGAIAALLLFFVARPLLKRSVRGRSGREILASAGRLAIAVVLALVVSDRILRHAPKPAVLPPKPYYGPTLEDDALYKFRPVRSHVTEHHIGDKTVRIAIDENGYRVRSLDDRVDFARPTILFTGESITEGFGLDYDQSYPAIVGKDLGVQVANVSVMGYGNDGAYLRLSEELPRFAKPLATVTLIAHVMIQRNTFVEVPHVVLTEGGGRFVEPARKLPAKEKSPLLELFDSMYQSDEALRRARTYIVATIQESKARGAIPLFVLTNWKARCMPDETGAPSIEHTLFDGLGVDVDHVRVDLSDDTFDPAIDHPGPAAHEQIAATIERALRERGIGETASAK